MPLPVDVGDSQAVGFRRHRVSGRGQKAPLAVAEVDAQPVGGEDGQVVDAVAGEVAHADDLGRARGLDGDGIGEPAAAQAGEHVHRVRAGVDRHQVGRTAGRERPGGDARRRLQAGHLGRAAGIDRGQSRSRRDKARAGRRYHRPGCSRTLTWPVSLLVTTRSSRPLPVVSTAWTSETPRPTGRVTGGQEGRSKSSLGIDGTNEASLAKKTESVPSPALRTTRSSKPSPFKSAAMICAGSWPVVSEPIRTKAAVAVGVERDRVVLGVDAGEQRPVHRVGNPGDVARGELSRG